MTPTLKMFTTTVTSDPHYMDPMYAEVRSFTRLGGTLLFGTDVGYMTDYTTEGEFVELGKCGLDWRDVLAMLTTNPAARMGVQDRKGTVTAGQTRRPHHPRRRPRARPDQLLPGAGSGAFGRGGLASITKAEGLSLLTTKTQ